ncbi:MAG: hypothetical protein U0R68_11220 [Candidatus Nanopelagicales bacterium]
MAFLDEGRPEGRHLTALPWTVLAGLASSVASGSGWRSASACEPAGRTVEAIATARRTRGGLVAALLVLGLGDRVGHEAGVRTRDAVLDDAGADRDRGVEVAREVEVADAPGVDAGGAPARARR